MKTMIWKKEEWISEYDEFMQNVPLKQLAGQEAPQVLEWFEARVKIVQLAERMLVAPPPPPENTIKKKKTAEEVRALLIRREGVPMDYSIARMKLKATKIIKAKAALGSLPLEDDER